MGLKRLFEMILKVFFLIKWLLKSADFGYNFFVKSSPQRIKTQRLSFNLPLCAVFTETAWQSINLNANLPLDCHEFARSRFANSRNDKVLVILSVAKYPQIQSVNLHLKCGFFAFLQKAQNDKGLVVILSAAKYPQKNGE